MRLFSGAMLVVLLLVQTANGNELSENYVSEKMYRLCRGEVTGEDKGLQSMICTFRLQGVMMMMVENCHSIDGGFQPMPLFTASSPPSNRAARQAFVNFMESNPEKWGDPWHVSVVMALAETFPCDK